MGHKPGSPEWQAALNAEIARHDAAEKAKNEAAGQQDKDIKDQIPPKDAK